jgi:hypothetical protein
VKMAMQNKGKAKLWLERLGVALITVVALGAPFVFGFLGYLGLKPEGVVINEGDPQREMHIWIERERRGLIGFFVQRTLQKPGEDGKTCTYTHLIELRWRPEWSFASNDGPCQL